MTMTVNQIAAYVHKRMCDDDRHGYSWEERHGASYEKWKIDGREYTVSVGDYDCSSSSIDAWRVALQHTKHRGALDAATYTGNMKAVFLASGLFEWKPMSFLAEPGDLYLNEANHVAMCQTQVPDVLSEFSWGDNGAYGNKRGDQSGQEAYVHAYYDYPWDGILHYNGKAEGTTSKDTKRTQTVTVTKKRLNGIDIASHQAGIDVAKVDADFVVVKVSGGSPSGKAYVNPYWKEWANKVLESGKLLGLYHYACEYGIASSGKAEADFFLKQIKGFEGKAVLCLDWEADAQEQPVSYAKAWLDTVAKATGSTPVFYGYASYLNSRDHSAIAKYPLWMASYLNRYEWGQGYVDNPDNTWNTGSWSKMTMYQYASTRTIKGYGERLDVNVFYGTRADWQNLAGGKPAKANTVKPAKTKVTGNPVKYRTSSDVNGLDWFGELLDHDDPASDDDYAGEMGVPIRWFACNAKKYRSFTERSGWLPWVGKYNISNLDEGCAGDGSPILAVEIADGDIVYQAHVTFEDGEDEWYEDMKGSKQLDGKSTDHFAGDLANVIDAIRCRRA